MQLASGSVRTLVLPKVHSALDLHHVSRQIHTSAPPASPVRIIPSIESAKGMWNLGSIASWSSEHGAEQGGVLSALLVRVSEEPLGAPA